MVVADNAVSEGRKPLFDTLDDDAFGEGVAQVLKFVVRASARDKETSAVSNGDSAHESASCDGSVHNGDVVGELLLKHAVKVFASADSDKRVGVGEAGEDPDLVTILELSSDGHGVYGK